MSNNNNNKQPPDLTDSLPVATGGTTNYISSNYFGTTNLRSRDFKPDVTTGNLSHSDEASTIYGAYYVDQSDGISLVDRNSSNNCQATNLRSRDFKTREKNDLITEVNQSTYYVDQSDEETIGFLLDCAEKGYSRGNQRPPSICMVSRILRDHNESLFTPQLVSIGPIHREDPKLKEFEWLKYCYLDDLLKRCHDSTPKETLQACLLKVSTLIPQVRESYAGMIKAYRDVDLARMMVIDGCFILEFCFKHDDDSTNWHLPNEMLIERIAIDLILLENQVPFFVLKALFVCLAPTIKLFCVFPGKDSILCNVLDKFLAPIKLCFSSLFPEKISTTEFDSYSTHDHVLGYLHSRYKLAAAKSSMPRLAEASKKPPFFLNAPSPKKLCSSFCKIFRKCAWSNCVMAPSLHAEASKHVDEGRIMHTASIMQTASHSIVELDRSGVNFKPHQEDEWSMTIKFQPSLFPCLALFGSKSTLLMPTLVIDDFTEPILRNFIAYEQSFPQDRYYFTSYAHAMSMLIDTQEDIAKLVESKVLLNALGSNQDAADMINKICKNMFVAHFYYTKEFKQVDKYYNGYWGFTPTAFLLEISTLLSILPPKSNNIKI